MVTCQGREAMKRKLKPMILVDSMSSRKRFYVLNAKVSVSRIQIPMFQLWLEFGDQTVIEDRIYFYDEHKKKRFCESIGIQPPQDSFMDVNDCKGKYGMAECIQVISANGQTSLEILDYLNTRTIYEKY